MFTVEQHKALKTLKKLPCFSALALICCALHFPMVSIFCSWPSIKPSVLALEGRAVCGRGSVCLFVKNTVLKSFDISHIYTQPEKKRCELVFMLALQSCSQWDTEAVF